MGYLTSFDYINSIQDAQLTQITSGLTSVRLDCEYLALDIFKSKLIQKYDVDAEFTDTNAYVPTSTYLANQLVYLSGTAYSSLTVYVTDDLVVYASNVYLKNATAAIAGTLPTNETYFTLLGAENAYYNTIVPNNFWDYATTYLVGDVVFYKNKNYTNLSTNIGVAPDDINVGVQYWGTGVAYSVSAGLILDDTKWQTGDNRNPQCVNYMLDVVIYEIMTRIPQRQIPIFRKEKADFVTNVWLEDCAKGDTITLSIPRLPFRAGSRIRVSQNTKNVNSY